MILEHLHIGAVALIAPVSAVCCCCCCCCKGTRDSVTSYTSHMQTCAQARYLLLLLLAGTVCRPSLLLLLLLQLLSSLEALPLLDLERKIQGADGEVDSL